MGGIEEENSGYSSDFVKGNSMVKWYLRKNDIYRMNLSIDVMMGSFGHACSSAGISLWKRRVARVGIKRRGKIFRHHQ